jgi:uncharacterized protein YcgI (DUF1989 family)
MKGKLSSVFWTYKVRYEIPSLLRSAVTAADSTTGLQKPKERKGATNHARVLLSVLENRNTNRKYLDPASRSEVSNILRGDRSTTIRRTTKEPCVGGLATAGRPKKTIGDILESFVRVAVHAIVHADNNKVVKAEEVEMMD